MNTYFAFQEFNDMLWATPAPILVRVGLEPVQVRLRGKCSVVVRDADLLQEKIPDDGALVKQVRRVLAGEVIDILVETGRSVPDVPQLAALNEKIAGELELKAEPVFTLLGLKLTQLEIHALESE